MVAPVPRTLGQVDTAATDGSDAEATFSPTLQRRQPCLLTYKRVAWCR